MMAGLYEAGAQPRPGDNASARSSTTRIFQNLILALIVATPSRSALRHRPASWPKPAPSCSPPDRVILAVFVIEIVLKLAALGPRFFRDPWNVFDFAVVAIALIPPASGPFAVLRSLRILRTLRLISTVPRMRRVVTALLSAISGLGAIIALLTLSSTSAR